MTSRTVKVSNLSPKATERDIHDFFSFSGEIERIDVQSEETSKVAFVTFKHSDALETAILLSGATIVDQIVSITEVEDHQPRSAEGNVNHETVQQPVQPTVGGPAPGSAVNRAQDMISTMLAKGYDLGKDAMNKAKTLDERHHISANASATVSNLDKKMGLSQKISSGTAAVNEHVKALDEKYHVSEKTRSALAAAEEKMSSAGSALMKNKYVFTSAAWVTGAFNKVTKAAGEVGQKTMEKSHAHEGAGSHNSG